jgi:uncharacterized protein with von Willebrand factor type A (vWA) domain
VHFHSIDLEEHHMTDLQRTLIAVLLDRSGSMETVKSDTAGGFNAFISRSVVSRARPS